MSLFGSTRVRGLEISLYDKMFIGTFALLFVAGLWFGRSGWGARHVGAGPAYATAYNTAADVTGYKPYSAFGPNVSPQQNIVIAQSVVAQYEQGQPAGTFKNVQVLKGYTYAQLGQIMAGQFAGALGVGCQYCHLGSNYAANTGTKQIARNMIEMVRSINSTISWAGPHLPLVSCQTCHMGQPKPKVVENDPSTASYPIDVAALTQVTNYVANRSQQTTTDARLLLRTMSKMAVSLGVGCTFCHNSRDFASYEVLPKTYALTMLGMLLSIDQQYLAHLKLNGAQLYSGSCAMCHRAYSIPPGAVPYNSLYAFKGAFPVNGAADQSYTDTHPGGPISTK